MKKLIASLLGLLLLCGCTAAMGEEETAYTAGLYKFALPNHTSVSAEKEIADGIHAFVAKDDAAAFELIGLTIDYKAENPLVVPDGQAADDIHFTNMLQMVIAAAAGDVKEAEKGQLRYALLDVDTSGDVKMIAYSRLDEDAGFLLLIAWKQEGKSDQTVERTMTILDAAKSAELLARPTEGPVGRMLEMIGNRNSTKDPSVRCVWLREAPVEGSRILDEIPHAARYRCIGVEGDYYQIQYGSSTGYVYKDFVRIVDEQ